jgi:hypothetical protein
VPAVDLRLQRVALVEQREVARGEGANQLREPGPERAGIAPERCQHLALDERRQRCIDLQPVLIDLFAHVALLSALSP